MFRDPCRGSGLARINKCSAPCPFWTHMPRLSPVCDPKRPSGNGSRLGQDGFRTGLGSSWAPVLKDATARLVRRPGSRTTHRAPFWDQSEAANETHLGPGLDPDRH